MSSQTADERDHDTEGKIGESNYGANRANASVALDHQTTMVWDTAYDALNGGWDSEPAC